MNIQKIAVFCGANEGNSPLYRKSAEELADVLYTQTRQVTAS